jgi:RimJ/RimL family protein N-acetyltransferase
MHLLYPIEKNDLAAIYRWPAYEKAHAQMDYALRENGWLDTYCSGSGNACYAAKIDGVCIGFSLLIQKGPAEAEFRIAIHPDYLGSGYGGKIMEETLVAGFAERQLETITLIVRKNNPIAQRLYEKRGFILEGETTEIIQGEPTDFYVMKMRKEHFLKRDM